MCFPSEVAAMLYGPFPVSIVCLTFHSWTSTMKILFEPLPAMYNSFPDGDGVTHVGLTFE